MVVLSKVTMYLLGVLFILSVPVVLLTSNLRLAFNSEQLYESGFTRYGISQATGIPNAELEKIAHQLISYWNSEEPYFLYRYRGATIYNDKEIIHLADVKKLIDVLYTVHWASLGVVLVNISVGFLVYRTRFSSKFVYQVFLGGLLTLALIVVTGISLAVAFPTLFWLFHELSFANDFWKLDPRTDLLIRMFPQPFWYHSTMVIVLATTAQAIALALIGWVALKRLMQGGRTSTNT